MPMQKKGTKLPHKKINTILCIRKKLDLGDIKQKFMRRDIGVISVEFSAYILKNTELTKGIENS